MSVPFSRLAPLALCASAILLSSPTASYAAQGSHTPGRIVLQPTDAAGTELGGPSYYQVSVAPGDSVTQYAFVGNVSKKLFTASLLPVDAKSGVYGGISYDLPQQRRKQVGAWIRLSTSQVQVHPGRAAVVSFTVSVPARTAPGQYVGGLTAYLPSHNQAAAHGSNQRTGSIILQLRRVVAVVVTVPGPAYPRFAVSRVNAKQRPDAVYLIAHIRNTGTILAGGQGHLWMWKQGQRKAILSVPLTLGTTVPRTTVLYPILWSKHPSPGRYSVTVSMSWNGGKTTRKSSFSWSAKQ